MKTFHATSAKACPRMELSGDQSPVRRQSIATPYNVSFQDSFSTGLPRTRGVRVSVADITLTPYIREKN